MKYFLSTIICLLVFCKPEMPKVRHALIGLAELADQAHDFKYTVWVLKQVERGQYPAELRSQAAIYLKNIEARKQSIPNEMAELENAIKFSQSRALVHRLFYKLAYLQDMAGNSQRAEKSLQSCLELKPASPYCNMLFSLIKEYAKDMRGAQKYADNALSSEGQNIAEIVFVQALQALRMGNQKKFTTLKDALAQKHQKYSEALKEAERIAQEK